MTVDWNPWFQAAVGLTLRIFLPGMAWVWTLPSGDGPDRGRTFRFLRAGALAAFIGLISMLAMTIALGEFGLYTPVLEWTAIGLIAAVGAGVGAWRDKASLGRQALAAVPAAGLFAASVVVVMALPRQGEWIVGGWDPGTYVDQGVFVSRHGTFRPASDPLFSAIEDEYWPTFVPRVLNFAEGLPVFPIDPETRRFEFFFFRGMPAAVAVADRCGGLRAATRINMILGLLALLGAAHVFWTWLGMRQHRWFALCLFAAHPLWLYHLHFPTSELLQQFLWFGIFGAAAMRTDSRGARVLTALGCFALVVTHIATSVFVGLFLVGLAWCDLYRRDRDAVRRERLWQAAAMAAGVAVDLLTSPTTVGRLDFILPRLLALAGLFVVGAMVLDRIGRGSDEARESHASALGAIAVGLLIAGVALALAGAALAPHRLHALRTGVSMLLPYLTTGLAILGVAGLSAFAAGVNDVSRPAKAALFLMVAATFASLVESAIAPLYPWATRRFVALSVPFFALAAGYVLTRLWLAASRWMRPAGTVVFAATLAGYGPWSWPAVTATEYDGLSARLAEAAAKVGPRDVLVVDRFAYGVPLRFLHGRHVINGERMAETADASEVERIVRGLWCLQCRGWTVRLMTVTPRGLGNLPFVPAGARLDWRSEPFVLREIEHSDRVADFRIRHLPMRIALYTWDTANGVVVPAATNTLLDIDIGEPADAVSLMSGFHGREVLPSGRTVRWTTGDAVVAIRGEWAGARVEVDFVDRHCPGGALAGGLAVSWNGEDLQVQEDPAATGEARRISATLPLNTGGVHRLRVRSAAWSPRDTCGSADGRALGVMLDRVRVDPRGQVD
jgi:hypothetical protein